MSDHFVQTINYNLPIWANEVKIQLTTRDYLQLAEVDVYVDPNYREPVL